MSKKKTTQQLHIEWLRHSAEQRRPSQSRFDQGWQIARRAAQFLREQYNVRRVRVFGSLLSPDHFHAQSDIDLGVEGLSVQDYWDALADILFFDEHFTIDLVDPDTCSPNVWAAIEKEGVDV